jgi:hypothetical protein
MNSASAETAPSVTVAPPGVTYVIVLAKALTPANKMIIGNLKLIFMIPSDIVLT